MPNPDQLHIVDSDFDKRPVVTEQMMPLFDQLIAIAEKEGIPLVILAQAAAKGDEVNVVIVKSITNSEGEIRGKMASVVALAAGAGLAAVPGGQSNKVTLLISAVGEAVREFLFSKIRGKSANKDFPSELAEQLRDIGRAASRTI